MAAINNNPFEYWITHDDAKYNTLMEDVSAFINDPVSVGDHGDDSRCSSWGSDRFVGCTLLPRC